MTISRWTWGLVDLVDPGLCGPGASCAPDLVGGYHAARHATRLLPVWGLVFVAHYLFGVSCGYDRSIAAAAVGYTARDPAATYR